MIIRCSYKSCPRDFQTKDRFFTSEEIPRGWVIVEHKIKQQSVEVILCPQHMTNLVGLESPMIILAGEKDS